MTEPANNNLQPQVQVYRSRLVSLMRRGVEIRDALTADSQNVVATESARTWQQDVGVIANELSGGSKAHWLARAFSQAFLVRGEDAAVESVAPSEIIQRLMGVLEQALASLSRADTVGAMLSSSAPSPHRFDFVHSPELRPLLEQAYADARLAFEAGNCVDALLGYSSILEAIVTDALQQKVKGGLRFIDSPGGEISQWLFQARLAVAEQSDLIGRGCARLPEAARNYRDLDEASKSAITEHDARVTGQVLHVVMRDLNPGR